VVSASKSGAGSPRTGKVIQVSFSMIFHSNISYGITSSS
jgi:hypothetical protein